MSSTVIQKAEDPVQRIVNLLDASNTRIRNTYLRSINSIKGQLTIQRLTTMLEQGLIEEAIQLLESIPSTLATAISFTFVASGTDTAFLLSEVLDRSVNFDQFSQRAANIMQNTRLRLVQEFSAEQRRVTIEALNEGIRAGVNPRDQARMFRDSIGLTSNQYRAIENYRNLLSNGSREALNRQLRDRRFDRTVERAVNGGNQLSTTQIDRMVDRYRERYLIYRSQVIARTESLRAVHQGIDEMYEQGFEQNLLSPDDLIKEWITSRRPNVRDSHNGMHGQKRLVGESFISDNGVALRYPGDDRAPGEETIQCVCVVTTRFK